MAWKKKLKQRIEKGNMPLAYNPYNDQDCGDVMITINTEYGIIGRVCTALIIREEEDE